jgi:diguanylate cyclase (GGDEF)-like protein
MGFMADIPLEQRLQNLEQENRALQQEVTRLRAENRRWARLAGTDALTGLPNKISFLRALAPQAIQNAVQTQTTIGFILFSADDLGPINETHGRMAGDQVLKGLGAFLKTLLPENLTVGHLDGSHFAIILPEANLEDVKARANMLRARIRSHTFTCGDTTAQITASAGIVAWTPSQAPHEKEQVETIFGRLNEALYKAKSSGGNLVQVVTNMTPPDEAL